MIFHNRIVQLHPREDQGKYIDQRVEAPYQTQQVRIVEEHQGACTSRPNQNIVCYCLDCIWEHFECEILCMQAQIYLPGSHVAQHKVTKKMACSILVAMCTSAISIEPCPASERRQHSRSTRFGRQ